MPAGLTFPANVPNGPPGWPDVVANTKRHARVIRRYLAARLFGNWIAYHGQGLRTIVEGLRVHLAVLRFEILRRGNTVSPRDRLLEAIRATDLLLVHYAESRALAHAIDTTS